jgi:hypothetical protein
MVKVLVNAWIPRSYLHVFEVNRSLKDIELETSDVEISDGIRFRFKDTEGSAEFHLDTAGQYTLSKNVKSMSEALSFIESGKRVLVDDIIKNSHHVVYKQIKHGSLPICFSSAIISNARPKGLKPRKMMGKDVFYEMDEAYRKDSVIYFSGKPGERVEEVARYMCFVAICSHFLFRMMDRMEEFYHRADEIVRTLEEKISLEELKKTIFDFDLIKKECGESYSKIEQMKENVDRKAESFEHDVEVVDEWFDMIGADWTYVLSLWELLINYLDNIDSAAEARMTYQEAVESRRIEGFLSIDAASIIAYLILGLFVSSFTGVWGLVLIVAFLITWIVIYQILVGYKKRMKIKRQ